MLHAAGILIVVAIIAAIEVPGLRKKKQKKELLMFSILLLIGAALSLTQSLVDQLPTPLAWIEAIFKPIHDVLFAPFK
ncbi:hypothetical protein [Alteribacillus bidgolensis]|uniref:Stage III sporulation protein AF n=1 Tax=Alteribacillus bidgolensis TaxID=930129 RepID=A0A1G8H746_9BACI|nr:hypothetical protein [Alteribacillus bidgolensis]SDI02360.1 hypothetical protein SAMN05216352_104136 [Alteribacillus bidgolensis]